MLKTLKSDLLLIKRGIDVISKLEPYFITLRVIRSIFNASRRL